MLIVPQASLVTGCDTQNSSPPAGWGRAMTDQGVSILRRLFLDRYDDLKARLTRRLGSADLAGDAMQDTWLRLARTESIGAVQSPRSYLFRIALNVAEDRRRMELRRPVLAVEIDSLLEVPDDAPTPERAIASTLGTEGVQGDCG